jgi:hypothetical protein
MLAAWCLNTCQPIHKGFHEGGAAEGRPPFVEAAESRLPLWMGLAGVQASSSKQQASIRHQAASIKHQASRIKNQASSIKHLFRHQSAHHGSWSTFDQTDIDHLSVRISSKFWDFQVFRYSISKMLSLGGLVLSSPSKIG